jgi:hypothetical protein
MNQTNQTNQTNEKAKLVQLLKDQMNMQELSENFMYRINLYPSYYKSNDSHIIVDNISVRIFGGSNTKPNQLGCVTFSYNGTMRRKRSRKYNTQYGADIFKKSFVPKTADETMIAYDKWIKECQITIKSWKHII